MLDPEQYAAIARETGSREVDSLVACLHACGFDAEAYLKRNVGLQQAGFDATRALVHFLEHGYGEDRDPPTGPLPDGLDGIRSLAIPNQAYARALFRTMFSQQVRHPRTTERLWAGADLGLIASVRAMGGVPYFVFGDSHANHYVRRASFGTEWLAGMPLVCHGASGAGLARVDAPSEDRSAILRWAAASTGLPRNRLDVPVFLKFGGIDAEFRWISHRLRHQIYAYSANEFDDYAARSVGLYGRFLDALAGLTGTACLRVCAAFPTTLSDQNWIASYQQNLGGTREERERREAALQRMEIPDFHTRTQLRGRFNAHLRAFCDARGMVFADDFTPFLNANGGTDARYIVTPGDVDLHLGYDAIGDKLAPIIYALAREPGT